MLEYLALASGGKSLLAVRPPSSLSSTPSADGWRESLTRIELRRRVCFPDRRTRRFVSVERSAFPVILRTLPMISTPPWPDRHSRTLTSHSPAIWASVMPRRSWSGTIIGSGIFLVPSEMMQAVGSAKLVYLAWFVGGLLSFFGALTYAELGAMKPQAGGEYVYVRDAYGPLGGFLYAWTTVLISKPASIATITTGFVRILGNVSAAFRFSRIPS